MSDAPTVLVLDDGELDDVRRQLKRTGTEFRHLRGAEIPEHLGPPRALLVTSARHAHHALAWPSDNRPICIGVVSEDSPTLRDRLRESGFDFLVRRPVHPAAMEMLLLRALFDGRERRRAIRHPVGHPITIDREGERTQGVLVDVSLSGARVLVSRSVAVGLRLQLEFPSELVSGAPFSVAGDVLRCVRKVTGDVALPFSVSLAFGELDEASRMRLESAIAQLGGSPARLPGSSSPVPSSTPRPEHPRRPPARRHRALPDVGQGERRDSPRAPFDGKATTEDDRGSRVVLGRDLSKGGMRIEFQPDFLEGDRVLVTLYGEPGAPPVSVRACVIRDDQHQGLALRFEGLSEQEEELLEAFVGHLPAVESLREGEADGLGAVVSEIRKDAQQGV